MTQSPVTDPPTKRCWACRSEIELRAVFCAECSKWQNWRRWLDFSATNLSLLVALVSVLGITLPAIKTATHIQQPKINAFVTEVVDGLAKFTVHNEGDASYQIPQTATCFVDSGPTYDYDAKPLLITLSVQSHESTGTRNMFPVIFPDEVYSLTLKATAYSLVETEDYTSGRGHNPTGLQFGSCKFSAPFGAQNSLEPIVTTSFGQSLSMSQMPLFVEDRG